MTRFLGNSPFLTLPAIALVGVIAASIIPHCIRKDPPPPTAEVVPPPAPPPVIAPHPAANFAPERPALAAMAASASLPRSPLADGLNAPGGTARDDLRILQNILSLYRERFEAYPAFGDNAQLVNALAGANPQRIGLLPRDAAAINPATGELRDRWGTPYVFHAISRNAVELRTAGPDRAAYTEDDVVLLAGATQEAGTVK